jgi:hypothetical protein
MSTKIRQQLRHILEDSSMLQRMMLDVICYCLTENSPNSMPKSETGRDAGNRTEENCNWGLTCDDTIGRGNMSANCGVVRCASTHYGTSDNISWPIMEKRHISVHFAIRNTLNNQVWQHIWKSTTERQVSLRREGPDSSDNTKWCSWVKEVSKIYFLIYVSQHQGCFE